MTEDAPNTLMQTLTGLLVGPPIWVWPLFVLLVFVGWRASRVRNTSILLYYFLPFLGFLTIQSVASLPNAIASWGVFIVAYGLAAMMFYKRQLVWVLKKQGRILRLQGEWITMSAVMVVFWANFVRGFLSDVAPLMYEQLWLCLVFATVLGLAGGSFLGRSVRIVAMPDTETTQNTV